MGKFTNFFGGGGSGRSNQYSPVADQSMAFGKKVVADAIAAGESGGDYSAQNPTSSAHGRYQLTAATDAEVSRKTGIYGEDPVSQDRKFDFLVATTYRQNTGRDIAEDAATGGYDMQIADALNRVWPSLPGGSQQNTNAMTWMRRMSDARAAHGPQARQTRPAPVVEPFPPPTGYTPDPALRGGAAPAAIRSSVTNDNSRTNTTSNDVDVHNITVNAPGGDPNTIARRIGKALQQHIVVQSDVGLA